MLQFGCRCNDNNREAWINAIQTHHPERKFNAGSSFYVCIRHFAESEYTKQKDKCKLNLNAIPSIFENKLDSSDSSENTQNTFELSHDGAFEPSEPAMSGDRCDECTEIFQAYNTAKAENEKLKHEIFTLKLNHDVKIQQLNVQIESLKNKLEESTNRLHTTRKKIDRQEYTIKKLNEINAALRSNHIADDVQNVITSITHPRISNIFTLIINST